MYVCVCGRCDWATVMGTTYRVNKCCMMIGTTMVPTGCVPQFGSLCDIVYYGQESPIFVFNVLETVQYHSTFCAYEVMPLSVYQCLYRPAIRCHHLFNAINYGNTVTKYIKSKYDLTVYCNY